MKAHCAGIAQLVEQRTENPRVTSSSLVPGIRLEIKGWETLEFDLKNEL